ncbi:MAG: enoyl-CoA hydratase-related protein [bacterium]|nr:enoyl-CoA hydratase-related protein [bacterium]
MSDSDDARVETRREGNVLVIRMVREAKRNAVDRKMADALDAALNELDDDDSLWAGVLTGGEPIFCAGSDLRSNGDYVTERGGEYGIIRRVRRKPLIAAVEGRALGGGLEIVLACDLVVASTEALFGLPEVSIGVIPTCAGIFRAPNALPLNLAKELILTGEPIEAERAHAAGFVNRLVAPGETVKVALELAARITKNAPLSVQGCLRSVNEFVAKGDVQGWALTERAFEEIAGTEDQREGVMSFLEKRSPEWKAR